MKYYCINLEKRKIKWGKFKEQFSLIGEEKDLTRVNGVDFGGGDVTVTRAACSAAHYNAISLGLESGEQFFTVFEDDVFFYDHTSSLISQCLDHLKQKDWHLLYWGCVPTEENSIKPLSETEKDYLLKINFAGSAHAITYNASFAKKLMEEFPRATKKQDWIKWVSGEEAFDMFLRTQQRKGLSYTPSKLCACQYSGYSDIDENQSNRQEVIERHFNRYK